jgi:hypothetical protein
MAPNPPGRTTNSKAWWKYERRCREIRLNLLRQMLAAVVLGAFAASLAAAGKQAVAASASRHARHHHQVSGPASAGRAPGGATPASADRSDAHPNGMDAAAQRGRAIPADRGRHGSRDRGETAATYGQANGGPHALHAINPDLIWTPPPGRNATHGFGGPGAPKKAAVARPAASSIYRRQRPDWGGAAAAKNAIGVATRPTVVNPTAAGRTNAGPNAIGGAVKANAIGAQVGLRALSPTAPGGAGKIAPGIAPANAGHPAAPALSAYGGKISGTGIGRPGSAPGVIGGPAKVLAGVSGTGMRPKR